MKFPFQLTTVFMIVASLALSSCAGLRHKGKNPDTPAPKTPVTQTQKKANAQAPKKADAKTPKKADAKTPKTAKTPAPPAEPPSKRSKFPFFSFSKLLPGPRVPVVKVRDKDLKELPTGHERALAFESRRKGGFWIFGGPVDFKEPTLPESGSELDGSLLPPRSR